LLFPVGALAAGAVKPATEYISIFGEQLRQLVTEIVVIRLPLAVALVMPVPGGKVNAQL